MPTLDERIRADLASALKAKDLAKANTLRMLMSAFKNAEIEKRSPLSDADKVAQVRKAIKMRREAIEGAEKAGRADLKASEEAEVKVLEAFLPAEMDEAALKALVTAAIQEAGAKAPSDMGKVMKVLMPKVGGQADGAKVSALVKAALSS